VQRASKAYNNAGVSNIVALVGFMITKTIRFYVYIFNTLLSIFEQNVLFYLLYM